jgi:hypothetical protein
MKIYFRRIIMVFTIVCVSLSCMISHKRNVYAKNDFEQKIDWKDVYGNYNDGATEKK